MRRKIATAVLSLSMLSSAAFAGERLHISLTQLKAEGPLSTSVCLAISIPWSVVSTIAQPFLSSSGANDDEAVVVQNLDQLDRVIEDLRAKGL